MSAVHANARVLQCNQFGMLVVLGILIFFPVGGLSAISFTNKTRQNGKIVQIFQKPTKKSERAKCEGTHGTYRGEPPQGYKRVYLTGEPKSGTTWLEVVVKTLAQKACSDPAHQCTYEKDCREMMTVPRTLPSLSRSTHLGSFFTMFDKHNVSPECDWFQQGFSNTMNRIKAIHSGHNLPPSNAASLAELCGFKGTLSLTMSSAERVRLGKVRVCPLYIPRMIHFVTSQPFFNSCIEIRFPPYSYTHMFPQPTFPHTTHRTSACRRLKSVHGVHTPTLPPPRYQNTVKVATRIVERQKQNAGLPASLTPCCWFCETPGRSQFLPIFMW